MKNQINPNSNIGINPQTADRTYTPEEAAKLNPLTVMAQNANATPIPANVMQQLRNEPINRNPRKQ
jgi:hypothetical protein